MNKFETLSSMADRYKALYPSGTRIELIEMNDPYAPLPAGMRGTVNYVDDIGQLQMIWDNGRALAVIPSQDNFRKLTEEEIEAEVQQENSFGMEMR